MSISSLNQAGMNGMRLALERTQGAAADIAAGTAVQDAQNLADALIELELGRQQAAVSTRVIEAGNAAIGTLLDISV